MTNKRVKQNNQQKVLLDFCENIVPLNTPEQQSYFVYTENGDIIKVKVYGKQNNIQTGKLFHIEGSFSAITLQNIITSPSSYIFFCYLRYMLDKSHLFYAAYISAFSFYNYYKQSANRFGKYD